MTQQDDITQRLRDNADLDEAEHGNARVVQLERDAADEIERLRAELSKLRAPVADERAAFKKCHSAIIKALASIAMADGPDTRKADDPELLYRSPVMDDVVRIRVALDECSAALASAPVAGQAVALELRGVPETIKEGGGFWRSCTGCHELNEGRDTGPYSAVLGCHLGQGCRECGGIGAVWDSTDYQAMADDMARDMGQSVSAAPRPSAEARPNNDAVDLARAGMALHAPGAPEHTVCAELVRLADVLKQPQADKGGARCTCPSGDGSLRHPCPAHPQTNEGRA